MPCKKKNVSLKIYQHMTETIEEEGKAVLDGAFNG